jgi:TfoX/Sxy family transcriptional regulator of competence genes
MSTGTWRKSPDELRERFEAAVAGIDGLEQRKMFGYPAGFVGGNMTTGLHQDSWIVRLPEDERTARLADGWSIFEPMPGRPMREYVALPDEVIEDPDQARAWVERAAAYVRTLPPKAAKPKAAPKPKPAGR